MKVLMVMTTKFEISGITNNVMNYFRYIDKSDMRMDFVVFNKVPDRLINEIEAKGGKVFRIAMRNKNPLVYIYKLQKLIREEGYDIVHAHGNSCTLAVEMLAAKLGGSKVRIAHSRNTACKHTVFHKLLRPIFDRTYTQGFACGYDAGKWLFRDKNFKVIINGNDIDRFVYNEKVREEIRQRYDLDNKKVVGHVGLFNYQKNHEFLINVFNELTKLSDEYVLMLIGNGELKVEVESKVQELGLKNKVIFVGQSLEVEKLLQAMDIMVLPSRYEGLPNVAIEWQIACLPSVISDKVTNEVKLTDLVKFLPLEAGAQIWATEINQISVMNREENKYEIIKQITDAGFNIKENAKELKKIYKSLIPSNNN
ncbi:glycosyltransferase family 1 [Paenibacillus sp. CCS19]|uniref:glycosyltransferase family 1 protein n=1 Tax=Paenibacillus sp. CCS19 TaxID=3158387 RepID=UPI0025661F64|nr:glycosyltransferase family 1 protein [Paenibacillus cellulosilyticus]GMK38137.1 glycosyltransferase family 1 [Paenibacillus cellulosilyticus]